MDRGFVVEGSGIFCIVGGYVLLFVVPRCTRTSGPSRSFPSVAPHLSALLRRGNEAAPHARVDHMSLVLIGATVSAW